MPIKRNSQRINKIKFLIKNITIIVAIASIYCSSSNPTNTPKWESVNINEFSLDKLCSHQVTLFGESKHGESVYKQHLIEILHYWIVNADTSLHYPRELGLLLEEPAMFKNRLYKFFSTKDPTVLFSDFHDISYDF